MSQTPHTYREFELELDRVRDNLVRMSALADQMSADSVRSMLDGDVLLARRTIDEDLQINRLELETDNLCLLILAKRQPLGGDLRFISAATKMVTDLERIGDLGVNIAERTLAMSGERPTLFAAKLAAMADLNRKHLREVTEALVNRDAELAQKIREKDPELDRLYSDLMQEVQRAIHDDAALLEKGVHVLATAKFLERIGDHITNLAELVIFFVRGEDIRHSGKPKRQA